MRSNIRKLQNAQDAYYKRFGFPLPPETIRNSTPDQLLALITTALETGESLGEPFPPIPPGPIVDINY